MATFDADTLGVLTSVREVEIRTGKHPKKAVTIWVTVADDAVFVRSWRGAEGHWYKDLAAGGPATLEAGGRRLAVQAVPARDSDSIARATRTYLSKYRSSTHVQDMVRAEVLPTTLRLEPRSTR